MGNAIPAVIVGLISGFLYYFLGYPYALLLAIISGIAMFIPIIGPWIVYGALELLVYSWGIQRKVFWLLYSDG